MKRQVYLARTFTPWVSLTRYYVLIPELTKGQSGTGALIDDAQGLYEGGIVYSDLDIPTIEAIPITAPHRAVDTTLVKADQEGWSFFLV